MISFSAHAAWALFLDDVRDPPTGSAAILARSFDEARSLLETRGPPNFIHFDHDLGDGLPTGFDFAKLLVEMDLDLGGAFLPIDFGFSIHSDNPPGARNIQGLLEGYLQHRARNAPIAQEAQPTILPRPSP